MSSDKINKEADPVGTRNKYLVSPRFADRTIPSAMAYPTQIEHDDELSEVLSGDNPGSLSADNRQIFQAIADAAVLCIDQFSSSEDMRSNELLFAGLKKRIGFTSTFDDIDLQKGSDGKNVSEKTYRSCTHRGWHFSEYPFPELWVQRKRS